MCHQGDFNLPNIDWTLHRPTLAPDNKLMQLIADNNLTQVHETTRQNNILDLVISTDEKLIVNLKTIDKILDHQEIQYPIKIEKGNMAFEKNNYNFRRAKMQCGLSVTTKHLNNRLSEIMPSMDL